MVEELMPVIECLKKDFTLISESNKSTINISEIAFSSIHIMPKSCSLIASIIQEIQLMHPLLWKVQVN